jgi:hypothetical protein
MLCGRRSTHPGLWLSLERRYDLRTAGIHTMTGAMQRINQVRKVLGRNDRWTLIQASDSPSIQRWSWKCGCLIECTGNGRNHEAVFDWNPCGGHPESGDVECLRAQQSPQSF